MSVRRVRVRNFKSFQDCEVELGPFNVLIGANASGKSNFVEVFRFLRDVAEHGLNNAISMQGGVKYLRNISLASAHNFQVEVLVEGGGILIPLGTQGDILIGLEPSQITYELEISFKRAGLGFDIARERLVEACNVIRLNPGAKGVQESERLGQGRVTVLNVEGKVEVDQELPPDLGEGLLGLFPRKQTLPPKTPFLEGLHGMIFGLRQVFRSVATYDFDPKLPKKATPYTGKADLEEDGSNLAIVLSNVIKDSEGKRKLSNLVRDLLPFVKDVGVQTFQDKTLLFKLKETYSSPEQYVPATLISDGTIGMFALIVALHFQSAALAIVEEPERNIHPHLIVKVVRMMEEVSKKKQIVVTTHSADIVKHAGIQNLLFVKRDREGFSTIYRPSAREDVTGFLSEELGIEDLYVQNLL
jgi:predicted ATPase